MQNTWNSVRQIRHPWESSQRVFDLPRFAIGLGSRKIATKLPNRRLVPTNGVISESASWRAKKYLNHLSYARRQWPMIADAFFSTHPPLLAGGIFFKTDV